MITNEEKEYKENLCRAVQTIMGTIKFAMSPGDVSSLKRLNLENPMSAAYWRLLSAGPGDWGLSLSEANEIRWGAVICAIANLGDHACTEPTLGTSMRLAKIHEMRVMKLLRSREGALHSEVVRMAKILEVKGRDTDPLGFAWLVLSDGNSSEDGVRRNIARDYYWGSKE